MKSFVMMKNFHRVQKFTQSRLYKEKQKNLDRIESRNIQWILGLLSAPSILDLRIIILQLLSILTYELRQKVINN